MKVFVRSLLLSFLVVGGAQAEWIQGQGRAIIENGNRAEAREAAKQAALRDASLKFRASVSSAETVENGRLTKSSLEVSSQAVVREIRVIDQAERGELMVLTLKADFQERGQCQGSTSRPMKKRVAVAGFPLLEPDDARVGGLGNPGQWLSARLGQSLRETGSVQVLNAHDLRLFPQLGNAPTRQRGDRAYTNVVDLSRELDAQFVVAGVIRDMSLTDPNAWGTSLLDRMQRGLGMGDQRRRLVVDLMVYDGFSGAPVFQRRVARTARWDNDIRVAGGPHADALAGTEYGAAVSDLVASLSASVESALACQPFITRIKRVEGRRVYLSSGAASGLRPADTLSLYRSYRFADQRGGMPELREAGVELSISDVHPTFSSGLISKPGSQLNIQRDDIAILW